MVIEDVIAVLKDTPPFQFLEPLTLKHIAESVSMEFYPKGTMILRQDGPPSQYLRIIKKGGVKIFVSPEDDNEVVIDFRSEGDIFGFLSLLSGDKSRTNVFAIEDTICYLISREKVEALIDTNSSVREFFHRSFLNKYLDRTFEEMRSKSLLYGGGGGLLFTTPIGDLASKGLITAPQNISIKDAAAIMSVKRISCLVIVSPDGVPLGIITDRDLRDKVVSKARDVESPVENIMSRALIKSDAREYCFESILKMIRYNIHHLLIIEEGRLKGIVTNHDLMMLQGTSPISVAREIEGAHSIEGLMPLADKINNLISLLLNEGAKGTNITKVIAEINDRLVRKVLEIAEKKFGPAPVPYCWIVFGSEGRKEQTFKTDQDNAIILGDSDEADDTSVREYFSPFTAFVRDSLVKCGFALCPADYMASNPQWCQPLGWWKRHFFSWISSPTPEALLKSLIFFDFRPLHGDANLADELRSYLNKMLRDQNLFFAQMAGVITKNRPPLGFFKNFIVEKTGEHKDELNLKLRGIGPIVDIARFYALETGTTETSTVERIHAMKDHQPIMVELGDEIEQAFEFITLLRLHHQIGQMENGIPPDNFINPMKLTNLERKSLKDSFQLILRIQDAIVEFYKMGMVNQ